MATVAGTSIITIAGRSMAAIAFEGGFKIVPATFRVGDGAPVDAIGAPTGLPLETMTALNNEVFGPGLIMSAQWIPDENGDLTVIELFLFVPSEDPVTGASLVFDMNEVGVYLADGTLFCIAYFQQLRKVAGQTVSLRIQIELENGDSIFTFSNDTTTFDIALSLTWAFIAGIGGTRERDKLHQEMHRIQLTELHPLQDRFNLLETAFEREHQTNGYHHNGVGTHGPAALVQVDEAFGLTNQRLAIQGPSQVTNLYVHAIQGSSANDGLTIGAPLKRLVDALQMVKDLKGHQYTINLWCEVAADLGKSTQQTGDGATTQFVFNVLPDQSIGIRPSSLSIKDGTQTVTDDGAGALTGDGTGTVNYYTGAIDVTFTAAPANGAAITIDYTPLVIYYLPKQLRLTNMDRFELTAVDDAGAILLSNTQYPTILCDYTVTTEHADDSTAIASFGPTIQVLGPHILSPTRTRGAGFVVAPCIGAFRGGRVRVIASRLLPGLLVDDTFSDLVTDLGYQPLLLVGTNSSAIVTAFGGKDVIINAAGAAKRGMGVQVRGGGHLYFGTGVEFQATDRAVDNTALAGAEGAFIKADANLVFTGTNDAPRVNLDKWMSVTNLLSTGVIKTTEVDLYE